MLAAARLLTGHAARSGAVVLCYHDVTDRGHRPHDREMWTVSVRDLRRQLLTVRRAGFDFVALRELGARLRRGRPLNGLAAVTFDDGLAGVHRHGLPLLRQLGVPATVFVVTAEIGRTPQWWAGAGPTMSKVDLIEAASSTQIDLASHTRRHPSLLGLSSARLRDEVSGSRTELEQLAGSAVDAFAYPFGHHDPAARAAVAEAGFATAYTFLNGRLSGSEDPFRLPRFTMGAHHGRVRLGYHLGRSASSWPDSQAEAVGPESGSDG